MRWRIKWYLGPRPRQKCQSRQRSPRYLIRFLSSRLRDVTLENGAATTCPPTGGEICHGAHFGEGPVLAILAMLARKIALRVAPGGSAPPIPCVARRGSGSARSGRESCRLSNRKAGFALPPRLTSGSGHGSILVRQCRARSGAFLDEAIRPLRLIVAGQPGANSAMDFAFQVSTGAGRCPASRF